MPDPSDILERLLKRDDTVRAAGQKPDPRAEAEIIEFIARNSLYANERGRRWLAARAGTEDYWVARRLIDSIIPLLQGGYSNDALSIFRSLLGYERLDKRGKRRTSLLGRQSIFQSDFAAVLRSQGLVSDHPSTWGNAIIELQADLLIDDQQENDWRGESRSNVIPAADVDYESYSQRLYFERERPHDPVHIVAECVERGMLAVARSQNNYGFRELADRLIATKWGIAKSQPLIALVDCAKEDSLGPWQCEEAVRLLTIQTIVESPTAYPWRRLLRCYIQTKITAEQITLLVEAIRRFAPNNNTRLNELADLVDPGVLTEDEISDVAAARGSNNVYKAYDPRDMRALREGGHVEWSSATNETWNRWPFEEDRPAVRTLVERKEPTKDLPLDQVDTSLQQRLQALRTISKRQVVDENEWFGEVLEWCAHSIADLKHRLKASLALAPHQTLPLDTYVDALGQQCPWWKDRAIAALTRLSEPLPQSHTERQHFGVSYDGGDPVAGSLRFLDELLAAPPGSELDSYRDNFYALVCNGWKAWPAYTCGLSVWLVRECHWRESDVLRGLLVEIVERERDSEIVDLSLGRLIRLGCPQLTQLLQLVLVRIEEFNKPRETAHLIGSVVGNAVIRYRAGHEAHEELRNISEWFDAMKLGPEYSSEVGEALITSVLDSAERHIALHDNPTREHATEWLSLVKWGINRWLDAGPDVNDTRHLPNAPIRFVREHAWSRDVLEYLLVELNDLLIRIFHEGGLGEFNLVHFECTERVDNARIVAEIGETLPVVAFLSDGQRLGLCRASAERVADWRREGKKTNDLGFGSSLTGQDTKRLIEKCFAHSGDRNHVRRELATIVDILADAGLRNVANELRATLRH